MNDKEKRDLLARWLAKRLDPTQSNNDFWPTNPHFEGVGYPKLDGNFAAAVIATLWETRRWWVAFSGEPGNYRACFFHGKKAIEEVRHDAEDTFYLAVCLAARAALEGGAE